MAKRPFRPPFPWIRIALARTFILAAGTLVYGCMMYMPGRTKLAPLAPLTPLEISTRERLRVDLQALAVDIGERHVGRPEALERAAQLIEERLRTAGQTPVRRTYTVADVPCSNIEVILPGRSASTLVVGAHYDTAGGGVRAPVCRDRPHADGRD